MKKAIDFTLSDKDNKKHILSKIKSAYTILYFYPKDNTPGCTIEAREFSVNKKTFDKLGATVVGISGGDEKTKTKFCEKNKLSILLLSDTDYKVSKKYKLYGEKKFMGHKYMGISRTSYLLDKNKNILHVFEKVKPFGHAKEVMDKIKELA